MALTGYVQITNTVEFDISTTKLVVVLLCGKGVVDMASNTLVDPEEDGHMYHNQLIGMGTLLPRVAFCDPQVDGDLTDSEGSSIIVVA